jgi:hypothetical protein
MNIYHIAWSFGAQRFLIFKKSKQSHCLWHQSIPQTFISYHLPILLHLIHLTPYTVKMLYTTQIHLSAVSIVLFCGCGSINETFWVSQVWIKQETRWLCTWATGAAALCWQQQVRCTVLTATGAAALCWQQQVLLHCADSNRCCCTVLTVTGAAVLYWQRGCPTHETL